MKLAKKNGDNPHFWYSPDYVNQVVAQMEKDLIAKQPGSATAFKQQYSQLQQALAGYQDHIAEMKRQYRGVQVAATEDIFVYLADAAGLKLISPRSFMKAVAGSTDPPVASIVQFQNQLKSGLVKVLVYNKQTATPMTNRLKKLAVDQKIPVVGITETLQPPDAQFQDWMGSQVTALQNALNSGTTSR